jgi:hypothetical protein
MALRGSSPVNLSALQRDYSALPKIAAIKAQANQGIFNAIQSGLEKRQDNIKKKEEKILNIKLLQELINEDVYNQVVPSGLTAEELGKYVSFSETMEWKTTLNKLNRETILIGLRAQEAREAARLAGGKLTAVDNGKGGTEFRIIYPDGSSSGVTRGDTTPGAPTSPSAQVKTPSGFNIAQSISDLSNRSNRSSSVDPRTGRRLPDPNVIASNAVGQNNVRPAPREQTIAERKAIREELTNDILRLAQGGASPEAISTSLNVGKEFINGVIYNSKKKLSENAINRLKDLESIKPGIIDYVESLAMLPKDKGQAQDSGLFWMGKEYEAGFGDFEANEEFNVHLRNERDLLEAYQVPKSTIEDIMQLEYELPEKLSSETKYRVRELNTAARPFE